ncbi:transglutaminase-like domain-containing protein [Saccharibacillus sp. CPCC 101409]|uniref:transglutaminase-like domain-containing protein n=1 Tax=Saccharibacillus sp. CPCC 101409 TaxID=3058041 RepID=UPI00267272B3|nr:transglutaminase-like domain-containing protein [Saccharibacillus sp. CPCC 101409]MDO3411272.1 transglutaminase-like domain-containing protein [Saccharibacillus sp. CPCC 101409]
MRSWIVKITLALSLAAGLAPAIAHPASAASVDAPWLDTTTLQQGTVGVSYSGATSKRVKVMISKASTVYTYDLNTSKASESFPLQSGNGSYEVTLLENTSGTSYKKIGSSSVELTSPSANEVFLGSVQNVNWKDAKNATALAQKLTAGKKTDKEKAQAIYNYVISNVSYDYDLAKNLGSVYLPSADQTLSSKKGICYDYSSLMAVMLRSSGIPTKLVMGSTSYVKEYHAWNEVYLDGKWVIVDTTVDAAYKKAGKSIGFAKEASKYSVQKVY